MQQKHNNNKKKIILSNIKTSKKVFQKIKALKKIIKKNARKKVNKIDEGLGIEKNKLSK